MLNINNNTFKTTDDIKKLAPSVFTATASSDVSSHYTHIPTSQLIEDMATMGWGVVDAKEVRARKGVGFQKHLLVFRNNDIVINGEDGDTVYPQILLTNSHDGKNSFTFTAGLFRMICENGLVISTKEFENVKMRHMGYTFEELQQLIHQMVEKLPLTVDSMNRMKQIQLEQDQIIQFAKQAIATRLSPEVQVNIDEFITPTRPEDQNNDLWSVYNTIQEKLTHGMFSYTHGTKTRKARRVKNFTQDMKMNKQLFEIALEYAN